MSGNFIYFDNINTTFPDEEVVACMEQALHSKLGNPSAHIPSAGIDAARLLDNSRDKVAAVIGAQPDSVIFTSGATEATNLAISGFMGANPDYQLAVLSIEHFSIINQARKSKLGGRNVLFIDVDRTGLANLEQLAEFVRSGPTLVSIAYANPEIGTVQQ